MASSGIACRFAHQPYARSTTEVESTSVPSISNSTALQVKVNGMKMAWPRMKLTFCCLGLAFLNLGK
jgi:hypothetical protein